MPEVKSETTEPWYRLKDETQVDSPSLLVYPERIDANIGRMLEIAGGPDSLRPHVKTYKMADLRGKKRKSRLDRIAAQIILATYLESTRSARLPPGPIDDKE